MINWYNICSLMDEKAASVYLIDWIHTSPDQGCIIHSILPIHTCIYSYLYKYLYNTCILYQLDITDCAYMQNSALYGALHTCMMRAIIVDLYCIFSQLSHTCI